MGDLNFIFFRENFVKMAGVSFEETDWFRGLICSLASLGMILIGYAVYYGYLEKRWPDYNVYDEDEDESDPFAKNLAEEKSEKQVEAEKVGQENAAFDNSTEKVEEINEYEEADL